MRFWVVRRSTAVGILALALAFAVSGFSLARSEEALSVFWSSTRKLPIYCVEKGEEKVVALTFDAAWGADKTGDILDLLGEYGAEGTFFVVGFWAEKYSDKLTLLKDKGIEIGTHSNTHPDLTKLTESKMQLELSVSCDTIERITGSRPAIFRCPFGAYSDTLLGVAEKQGLKTVQWDVDSLDWKDLTARQIAERVLGRVKNGSIVLMHNDGKNIVAGLRLILEGLKQKDYKCVTVSDLIYQENYKIDSGGKQIRL